LEFVEFSSVILGANFAELFLFTPLDTCICVLRSLPHYETAKVTVKPLEDL